MFLKIVDLVFKVKPSTSYIKKTKQKKKTKTQKKSQTQLCLLELKLIKNLIFPYKELVTL